MISLLSVFVALSLAAAEFPKVGAAAPPIQLKSQAAKEVKLSDFKGKWVVLYFYPKDFTGGCTIEAKNFQRDIAQYTKRNATIVGVSVDSAQSHKEFCTKEGLNFTLLSDPQATASKAYNSTMEYNGETLSARNTFVIDPKGNVARVFPGVKPAGHSEEVLAALDELQR
jgi:peroxiredoxin Q/BCP